MKKYYVIIALFVLGLLSGCNSSDDSSSPSSTDFSQHFGSAVSRDFIGQVVDQNGHAVQSATVKIGTATAQTDINGVFIINGANVYKRFAYITAKKAGFIDGSRAMVPTTGKNMVKIMLIANTPVQTISSGTASEVALPNGTKVNFDGAFEDENGNAYSGEVRVAMFHLESSNANISSLMPGMLYAEDNDGKEKVLETYGMMNVELKGASGQKLQIANGHTAQITMAIDPAQLASAPATIPLWHFDETKGYWKEDGIATKVGTNYVGTVSHFSWWNCDYPYDTNSLTIQVVDTEGNPVSQAAIKLALNEFDFGRVAITDYSGTATGMVPLNETFDLEITLGNGCGLVHSSVIGPFSTNTALTITVDLGMTRTNVQGTLVNCDNQNVIDGYVIVNQQGGGIFFAPVINGYFSTYTSYCNANSSFSLRGYDLATSMVSERIEGVFSQSITDLSSIIVCGSDICLSSLEGVYNVQVVRADTQQVQLFPNETIYRVGENQYKTGSTGTYAPGTLVSGEPGFYFTFNCQGLTVPIQNLASVYSNIVRGIPENNANDGTINSYSQFQVTYQIGFNSNTTAVRYDAVYTRI
jgi:hypothetical protein